MWNRILQRKPLSRNQAFLAKNLSQSKKPFERFAGYVGLYSDKNILPALKKECAQEFSESENYAHSVLLTFFRLKPSEIISNLEIKDFIFKAAKSKKAPSRINAALLLATIAKKNKEAYKLLNELKKDKNEFVRRNAEILLDRCSPKKRPANSAASN